jgi:hypothetical protein
MSLAPWQEVGVERISWFVLAPLESSSPGLSSAQQDRLTELEGVIERGLQSFLEVGRALLSVRDEKLYLPRYSSFEEYCQKRWQIRLRHARRLIKAVAISENLNAGSAESNGDCPLPDSENVLRPLSPLEPPLQAAVWKLAHAVSPSPSSRIVGRIVGVVRRAIQEGEDGAGRAPRHSTGNGNSKRFLSCLHGLADNRLSPYFLVERLNEAEAERVLFNCQRVIEQSHEFIEIIRMRFPRL